MDPSPAAGGPSGSVSPAVCLPSPGSHEPPRSLPEEPERLGAQGVRTRLCQGLRCSRLQLPGRPQTCDRQRHLAQPYPAAPPSLPLTDVTTGAQACVSATEPRASQKATLLQVVSKRASLSSRSGREAWMRDEKRGGDVRIPTSRASQWSLVRRSERAQEAAS